MPQGRIIREKRDETSLAQKIPIVKGEIMNRVMNNPTLQRLLKYDVDTALREPLLDNPKKDLLYKKVFPYRFVPDAIEKQGTYITVGAYLSPMADGFGYAKNYNSLTFYLYIFTHVDLMITKSGIRQDLMLSEIDKIFDKTPIVGMGNARMRGVEELWLHNNKFGGYVIGYTIGDM